MERMEPLARDKAPVEVPRADRKGAHWIEPKLVAEIDFAEFTDDGILRHPSFVGAPRGQAGEGRRARSAQAPVSKGGQAKRPSARSGATAEDFGIEISSPDRVIFPDDGVTKGELADYYATVEPLIMVDAANRPMTLIRCPQGTHRRRLFPEARHGDVRPACEARPDQGEATGTSRIISTSTTSSGLLACVQMGTIEFHGWGSKVDKVEYPDRLVFDLDPDVGLDFANGEGGGAAAEGAARRPWPQDLPTAVGRQGPPRRRAARRSRGTGRR